MQQPTRAVIKVLWYHKKSEDIFVQHNPTELAFDKSAQIAEINIPGLDTPIQQFVRGQTEKLSVELFFDTTDDGMGKNATSVTKYTDQIYQLLKIESERHAPPVCIFLWNDAFPGRDIGSRVKPEQAVFSNQTRNAFKCVVESVKQKFTLFSPEGVPLRATVNVVFREYKTLDEQFPQLNRQSPDRTKFHVLQQGDTLAGVAGEHYARPNEWRAIADANEIEDPRRIDPGAFLRIPPITGAV